MTLNCKPAVFLAISEMQVISLSIAKICDKSRISQILHSKILDYYSPE